MTRLTPDQCARLLALAHQVRLLRLRCEAEGYDTFLLGPLFRALEVFDETASGGLVDEDSP